MLSVNLIKMFTLIDLQKLCKRFLILGNSRNQGTLANLKVLIQRSNVNGQVKSRFKVLYAHVNIGIRTFNISLSLKVRKNPVQFLIASLDLFTYLLNCAVKNISH